ncbi:CHASE domain-containing protein [Methylococcus sp. EFPC2]|uniref:CHASE domain-containing protein n=1 Tax=Methylococcus sp. EFPC2 TaxID=2812648 RepID=UPI001968680B|nr:CHASE domain-containing protein [Methylococcus sp. EFPC2]QSA98285.1 CHASE domain-containing protein [Methylococcus sp. EFPC2]
MLSIVSHVSGITARGKLIAPGLTGVVLSLALAVTYGLWSSADSALERDEHTYFDFRVRQLRELIENRLDNYQQVLYGTRGLFAASVAVDRAEFHDYIAALSLEKRYPGVQGVGFALRVPKEQRDKHVEDIRRQGYPDYDIYPEGDRDSYTAIVYLEPFLDRNLRAFGYDMFAEPVRNQAMCLARDGDAIGVSGKVVLVQETEHDVQAGFLMYLPVYKNGLPHDTVEQRRANIVGWVYSPFRIKDLMEGIGGERAADLGLEIFDGTQADEETRLYGTAPMQTGDPSLHTIQQLLIAGHPWTLSIHAEPGFQSRIGRTKPLLIAGTGIAFSALLTLLVWQFMARGRALALAAERAQKFQESEARFRLMANSAPVLIWLARADHQAVWFNKRWLNFTGRTMVQELGQGWLSNVHPEDMEIVRNCYAWHFEHRLPFNVDYRYRRHDGEYRWMANTGVPRFDKAGDFVGFIGTCIDITDHKLMEAELLELATTDALTGFLNRRYFLIRLQEEFARLQRHPEFQTSVLMLDLDHFKHVNDTYGHATGDALLKHFARIVRTQQRKTDLVGRMGGEEFAIALPGTGLDEAGVFAERLRQHVADTLLQTDRHSIAITVSIGIALMNSASISPDGVLTLADHALYAAKNAGRNRVHVGNAA